jgi:Signal transduction histidine kinase
MSRIESGKLVLNENIFSIDDFLNGISSIVSTQCSAGKIKYMCRRGNNLHSLYEGDSLKLQQILINLIGNSIKFTPENGSISLDADEVMLNDSPFVRFIVTDNGCGISKEFIPYLFDSFSQEKRLSDGEIKGSGLGLAICRSLAAMMGGNITVSSEVGRGSEFTVFVKLRCIDSDSGPQPKNDEIKEKEQDIIDFRGCRVLLAEDNDLNMEIARHVLENANLIVDTAENGQAAVERFCASSAGYYTAILMTAEINV